MINKCLKKIEWFATAGWYQKGNIGGMFVSLVFGASIIMLTISLLFIGIFCLVTKCL